jgi:ferrous iron transport protein A
VLRLSDLRNGVPARVVALEAVDGLAARMRALGLRPGRELAVVRRSRFGGPLQVRVGTTDLVVRAREARRVLVHPLTVEDAAGRDPRAGP